LPAKGLIARSGGKAGGAPILRNSERNTPLKVKLLIPMIPSFSIFLLFTILEA
jgi:hypothetical protein